MNSLRIGLTMRVVDTKEYLESRDALAQDWPRFMRELLPQAKWLPMPNLGQDIKTYIRSWDLNGFIITGGNNPFERPERDETELVLLKYALENDFPVFGVCRGFQIMALYFGYEIMPCADGKHSGTKHLVNLHNAPFNWKNKSLTVNSFHDYCGPAAESFAMPVIPFAKDSSGIVEGFYHQDKPLVAVMWHPEREIPASEFDKHLIRHLFQNKGNYK